MPVGWEWDETLYQGSAPYYARGRLPYAPGLAARLAEALDLDGHGRLLDVGCGPGILTLTLAPLFGEAIGVDPDRGMLAEGARRATEAGIGNTRWVQARAEELSSELGPFRVATFGQSFHWMDRERVAALMRTLIEPGGAFVHVSDATDKDGDKGKVQVEDKVKDKVAPAGALRHPAPPYVALRALIAGYLGPVPRAGQGFLHFGSPDGEAEVLRAAGYPRPQRLRIAAGPPLTRTTDDLLAWVYSLSGSAPHLFGRDLVKFEGDVRRLLLESSPTGRFSEQPPDTEVLIWQTPPRGG